MVFKHSRYPNAAKEYLRFMMEAEQYDPWLVGCGGYWAHPLNAYGESEVWRSDPKLAVYRDVGTLGSIGMPALDSGEDPEGSAG